MNEVFYLRQNHYNLRNFNVFATDNPHNKYLLNYSVYRVNQLWQTLLSEIKDCASLQIFKDQNLVLWYMSMSDLLNIYCNIGYF